MKKILMTSGDPNGVGLEVTAKALEQLGPQRGAQFYIFRSTLGEATQTARLDKHFKRLVVSSWEQAQKIKPNFQTLIDIQSSEPAPRWVEVAARACHGGFASGLVTAPLSKTLIQKSGYKKAKGHTEILQQITGASDVHMVFIGQHFNVLLATGHIPLEQVPRTLTKKKLETALQHALALRKVLKKSLQHKPVALLGLNPHAGEAGLLGKQELQIFSPLIKKYQNVVGPLPPDVAFLKKNWDQFSVFVCPYHDQGLIPFKMIHGAQGYHLTFGLPFIRTSVDHGTAFDIYGKNKADPSSMKAAIQACLKLSR